jgi:hypothetical protein
LGWRPGTAPSVERPRLTPRPLTFLGWPCYRLAMTKLLEEAIAKAQSLPPEDQDALALAMLSLTEGDASAYPIDDATRAAILEGLAEADREDYVPDEVVAAADKRHGI